jgi:SH3-like domain-containing protein
MSGAVLRILPKGTPVQVLQSENGWLRVGERDGAAIGWVYGSLLK